MGRHLVLVVDDDSDTRDAVMELLEDSGYAAVSAKNGDDALRELKAPKKPDVILIDLHMPGMGGEALCRACAGAPELAAIPRVVISGAKQILGAQSLARALVPKPMRAEQLLSVLDGVLQAH